MQHPVTNEYQDSRRHIEETLKAIDDLKIPTLWFWPNVDAGADGTSTGIRAYREFNKLEHVHFFKNMTGDDFLKLLNKSMCLIGNSSVGIRECAYLGVPVVNIGSRQNKRDRGFNVKDVDYNKEEIKQAILKQIENARPQSSDVYGGGNAGEKIADLLSTVPLKFHKTITY
ncbi:UDP-N-acetylglucosamine 2-epimerase [Flavobacterium sediminis]|uniref:UDP-N-acetylglucosamine 2-epimerase n=2 Tax=Flavobacterium TaxID=237 RepID=UPI0026C0FFE7|nr:UDP-N-acetylglucosamine 2-epimerase [Flavobacterium sediminis]